MLPLLPPLEELHFVNYLPRHISGFGIPQAEQAHSCPRDFVLALLSAWKTLTSAWLAPLPPHILSDSLPDSIKNHTLLPASPILLPLSVSLHST